MTYTEPSDFEGSYIDLPHMITSGRRLYDLEMLLNGGFSPLTGFLNEDDYNSVVSDMRLKDGTLWPIPIVLDVTEREAESIELGDQIVLTDPYGRPLAVMTVESKYRPDKQKEVKGVYNTDDTLHFGVRYILNQTGPVYLGGPVAKIRLPERSDFKEHRKTPREQREWFRKNGWNKVVAFQTRNPVHRGHFELFKRAGEDLGAKVLIHPVVGETKDGDIDAFTRIKIYQLIKDTYANDFAELNLLPLAMRMGGPREAIWHALIRKNYGCTHFIVGRDHAGPGKNKEGEPFYDGEAAYNLVKEYEDELGIEIFRGGIAYVEDEDTYKLLHEVKPHNKVKDISGTEVRAKLRSGEDLPEWFSFPEVVHELRQSAGLQRDPGFTVFFTGLSGAGKTTIAQLLERRLMEMQSRAVTLLDGDIVRLHLSQGLGHTRADRDLSVKRLTFVANEITKHRGIALVAAIAPGESARDMGRRMIETHGDFIEVHVATPIQICEERDAKGLYKRAREGHEPNVVGVDIEYEEPANPEIRIETHNSTPEEAVEKIVNYIKERNLL